MVKRRTDSCRRRVSMCLVAMCGSLLAIAQVPADSVNGKPHEMSGVTVTERRLPVSLTAGAPVQRMEKAELERMGALDVSDAVRHFSGVSVKDYGGIGGMKTVSVRSLGAQHTAVSYDGVAVGDCQSGQVDISRFSLDNVSALTLTIGQGDDIFQPAKALASAGVLSIETGKPDFGAASFRLAARVKSGSFGLANPSLFGAVRLGGKAGLSFYGDYLRADGIYPFEYVNGTRRIKAKRNNSDIQAYRGEANFYASLGDGQDLRAKLYLFHSERRLPGSVVYDNTYAAERLHDRNYFGQLNYEVSFSPKWKLKAAGKFNYVWNRDTDKEAAGMRDDRFRQTETYLTATLWSEPLRGLSFSLAQDFAYNDLSTTLSNCQYPERYTVLTALSAQYWHPVFRITASLLNTYITENVRTGTAADDRQRLSPAVSLSWRPLPSTAWRLRASYKDIFRMPTFNDLYYRLIGNTRLRPESTRQWNVGTTWGGRVSPVVETLDVSVDAYYNKVKDKIVAVPTMFVWKMSNVGEVETVGVDVNVSAGIRVAKSMRLGLSGAYNFMQAEDVTDRDSKLWRNQIAYTPRHSGSGSLTWETPWVDVAYNVVFASERYRMPQNSADNRIRPYSDHSLSAFCTFRWGRHALRLQADALNLGGKNYEIVRFYPMPGRNYKFTVTYYL